MIIIRFIIIIFINGGSINKNCNSDNSNNSIIMIVEIIVRIIF